MSGEKNPGNASQMQPDRWEKETENLLVARKEESSIISTLTRGLSFGSLAFVWLLLNGTETFSSWFVSDVRWLLGAAVLAITALVFDYVQYVLALLETRSSIKRANRLADLEEQGLKTSQEVQDEVGYPEKSNYLLASGIFFWLKQVAALASSLILVVVLACVFISGRYKATVDGAKCEWVPDRPVRSAQL